MTVIPLVHWKTGLIAATFLVVAGCAPNPMHKDAQRVSMHCPTGHTMVCEAESIGRIRHGTFASRNERCGCVSENSNTLESPVIPTIQ